MVNTYYAEKKIKELLDTKPTADYERRLKHALLHRYYRIYKFNKRR